VEASPFKNYLRYRDVYFEVDVQRSKLIACIQRRGLLGRNTIGWQCEIHCLNKPCPDPYQPPHLDGPWIWRGFDDWRSLSGQELTFRIKESLGHPILPDGPCGLYVGWHLFPNNHVMRFDRTHGNRFKVSWTCDARESETEQPVPVNVEAEIAFSEVLLWPAEPQIENARHAAIKFFAAADLGEAERMEGWRDGRVRILIRSDVR
jgi:hypothetical protein